VKYVLRNACRNHHELRIWTQKSSRTPETMLSRRIHTTSFLPFDAQAGWIPRLGHKQAVVTKRMKRRLFDLLRDFSLHPNGTLASKQDTRTSCTWSEYFRRPITWVSVSIVRSGNSGARGWQGLAMVETEPTRLSLTIFVRYP